MALIHGQIQHSITVTRLSTSNRRAAMVVAGTVEDIW